MWCLLDGETADQRGEARRLLRGKAQGIGFEVCRQLAQRGYEVLLTARSETPARELAEQLRSDGIVVTPYKLDVTSDDDVVRLAEEVEGRWACLDVLINNAAGISPYGEKTSTANLADARNVMDATLFGTWRTCQAMLPLLRRSRAGRIVNVSSGAGSHDDPVFGLTSGNAMGPGYAIAKAALNALTSALATELANSPILVNAVCPGFTATFPGGEQMGARPVTDGAAGIVWAATLESDGPRGGFFRDGTALPW